MAGRGRERAGEEACSPALGLGVDLEAALELVSEQVLEMGLVKGRDRGEAWLICMASNLKAPFTSMTKSLSNHAIEQIFP